MSKRLLKNAASIRMAKARDWVGFGGMAEKPLPVPAVFAHPFKGIGQKGDSPAPTHPPSVQSLFLSTHSRARRFFNSLNKGYSLIEATVVLALMGLMAAIAIPALNRYCMRRAALDGLAREVCATMRSARQEAITLNAQVGLVLKEDPDGRLKWRTYQDGNGNGVLTRDIQRGVDRPLGPSRKLRIPEGRVRLGILDPGVPDISTGRRIENPKDPVKFGNSNICSFSPLGASSPGTIYFTDGIELQGAVRVYPGSAKVRIMRWDARAGWREF